MQSRCLAWFFILLAACPYTAPFSVCDLSQGSMASHASNAGTIVNAVSATMASIVAASRAHEEQLKDDEDQLNHVDVSTSSTIQPIGAPATFDSPLRQQRQLARPPLVALRL